MSITSETNHWQLFSHFCVCLCRKPTRQQISKRMMQICQREGLQVNESTLEALVEGANSDIRLILGQLQMVRLSSRALSYDEVKVCQSPPQQTDVTC